MTDIGAGQTILGCPLASFTSLASVCSITQGPACISASSINYNEACCNSLSSFAVSLGGCLESHAPTCLDTSAIQASLTGGSGPAETNPCAAYFGGGGAGGGGGSAPSTTAAGAAPSTAAGGSEITPAPTSGGAAGSSAAGATDTAASPSATASKSGSQRQHIVGANLKVYIGVAFVGALAVLSL